VLCPAASVVADPSPPSASTASELNNRGIEVAQAGDLEGGIALVRQAVRADPADRLFHTNLSGMLSDWAAQLSRQGQVERAVALLREALEHDPDNGRALVGLGDFAYVMQPDLAQAIGYWKRAYGKIPAVEWPAVAERVAHAERDMRIERDFSGHQTAHFRIRYQGATLAGQVAGLGEALEGAYTQLAAAMGQGPSQLTVLLYTDETFQRVAGRRDWALGLYDGRLRLRLDEWNSEYGVPLIVHELAHAFLAHRYGPGLPIWIHEGFAQVQEPPRTLTPTEEELLARVKARTSWVPLKWLDRRFVQPSNREDVDRAYVQARWVVERLIARHGMEKFQAFLAALAGGTPVEQAFDQALAPARWSRADQGGLD